MKINIVMPKMGESVNEGTIIKWHKKKGDAVKKDEIIYEISTDKVDTEIPSPADGILSEILVFEQETVPVDTVVGIIEELKEGEEKPAEASPAPVTGQEKPSTVQVGGNLIDIPMPKMGESVMEGTIIKWHKKPGDEVKKDEILFEISTDKVDTEVPSPENGILTEILVSEQQTVEVGAIVARISSKGGIYREKQEEPKSADVKSEKVESRAAEKPVFEKAEPAEAVVSEASGRSNAGSYGSNRFYSPLVMNIAQKENISFDELESINGTGAEGRVTKKDILGYLERRKGSGTGEAVTSPLKEVFKEQRRQFTGQQPVQQATPALQFNGGTEVIPMDNIRQKIMMHMVKSRDTSVHVSAVIEVDMSNIYNFIKNNKEDFLKRENIKLTYMPFIANACIKALKEHPYLNASISGTNIVLKKYINLGIAVSVEPNGLIVPNIKKADEKNIRGVAKAIAELSNKARTKKLQPEDISEGTFTITNYGVFGTLFGTPIINQPEVAILGVGTLVKKPVVVELDGFDTIAIKPMIYLSLSHDHRLVDGMLGGRFLKHIKDTLESFDASGL